MSKTVQEAENNRAIFADVMFINKHFQVETLQTAQTMKPLFQASNE